MRNAAASAIDDLVGSAASEGAAVERANTKSLELACSYLERAQQVGGDDARAWGRLALAFVVKARNAAGAENIRSRPQVRQLARA
jgi:hypothetical protein